MSECLKILTPFEWEKTTTEHKILYIQNGIQINKLKTSNSLAEYLNLPIKKIFLYPNKSDSLVKFLFELGEIEIPIEKISNSKEFKNQYYFQSKGKLLPDLKNEIWARLVTCWTQSIGEVVKVEETNEKEFITEKIIQEIESFTLVKNIKECINYGRAYLNQDEQILIPNFVIENIIKKNKWNYKLSKIAYFLEGVLARTSQPNKIGKKQIRFWYFKKASLNLDFEILEEKNDNTE